MFKQRKEGIIHQDIINPERIVVLPIMKHLDLPKFAEVHLPVVTDHTAHVAVIVVALVQITILQAVALVEVIIAVVAAVVGVLIPAAVALQADRLLVVQVVVDRIPLVEGAK
jgi:hypothetical protein